MMNFTTIVELPVRPDEGRSVRVPALLRAWHYQQLAHRHRDEELFWQCRASYFGRQSLRVTTAGAGARRPSVLPATVDTSSQSGG
jgi:hypothetical protein